MSKKTIKINPELFMMSSKKKTPKTKTFKKSTIDNAMIQTSALKKKFMERIKKHKSGGGVKKVVNTDPPPNADGDRGPYTEEFSDSLQYLSTLASSSGNMGKKPGRRNNTIKKGGATQPIHVELDLPENLQSVSPFVSLSNTETPFVLNSPSANLAVSEPGRVAGNVPWGCLKGGQKPTYRTWNRTQRQVPAILSAPTPTPPLGTTLTPLPIAGSVTDREMKLEKLKETFKRNAYGAPPPGTISSVSSISMEDVPVTDAFETLAINTTPMINVMDGLHKEESILDVAPITIPTEVVRVPKKTKKTTTRKYSLGREKNKRVIGVLIKDRQTRKKILNAHREIKRQPLPDVKKYLYSHGLIKAGCKAPNDVLRKMYEAAMLAGEVTNQDSDVLVSNFLQDEFA